jgi:hypothetical protein
MDQAIRNKLRGVVTQCRKLLEESVSQELQGKFGIYAVKKDAVQVDDECRTSMRNVWAVGDLTGEPIRRANRGVAVIPSSLCRQRHRDVRQPDPGAHVAIGIHCRHFDDEGLAHLWWFDAHDAFRAGAAGRSNPDF